MVQAAVALLCQVTAASLQQEVEEPPTHFNNFSKVALNLLIWWQTGTQMFPPGSKYI